MVDQVVLSLESFVTELAGEGPRAVNRREVGVQAPLVRQLAAANLALPTSLPSAFLQISFGNKKKQSDG